MKTVEEQNIYYNAPLDLVEIVHHSDLGEQLDAILKEVMRLLRVEMGGIYLVFGDEVVPYRWQGMPESVCSQMPSFPAQSPPSWMKEFLAVHEPLGEQGHIADFAKNEGIQTWASVPLITTGRFAEGSESQKKWLGTLILASRRYDALDEEDMLTLQALKEYLALVIDHSLEFHKASRRLARLRVLHEIGQVIIAHCSVREILQTIVKHVPRELDVDIVAISLSSEEGGRTGIFTIHLPNGAILEEKVFEITDSLLHCIVECQEPFVIYNLHQDPDMQMYHELIRKNKLASYLGVPLIAQGETIGILHIMTTKPRAFAPEDVEFFRTLAGQAAIALKNAFLLQQLRESEKKYHSIFDNMSEGFFRATLQGRLLLANSAMAQMLGYSSPEELLSSVVNVDHLYVDPQRRQEFKRLLQENGLEGWFESQAYRKDGSMIWISEKKVQTVRNENGEVLYYDSICEDISEYKRAEQALRESEERYRVTFETTGTALAIIEEDTTLSLVNSRFEELSGYSKEEIEGKKSWTEFVRDDLEKMKEYHHLRRIREGLAPSSYEFRFVDRYGRVKDILLTIAMIPGTRKSIASLLDITEHKQAARRQRQLEKELNQASRLAAVGELASGVAHEINNPLTAVIGFSELLMSRDIPEDVKQDVRIINENAQRVAQIVKNLLTFARQSKPGREYVDINSLVSRVLELRTYELRSSSIEVISQLAPDLPQTIADPGQLQQVFLNIIINAEQAVKETRNTRRLLVETKQVGNFIRVSFKDTGPGIPPENLDKIFDPFFTTKEVGEGTGLGLSISYGIIKEHKGRIYAKSKPGRGATFVVELPIIAEVGRPELAEPLKKEPGKVTGAKIMVVDDEAGVRQFLTQVLAQEGHRVEAIEDARMALERLKQERYHLILLDIKLPGMDGFEFYAQMGKVALSLQKRTVFITGDTMSPSTWNFLNRTRAHYIAKPFDLERLKTEINRILSENEVHI